MRKIAPVPPFLLILAAALVTVCPGAARATDHHWRITFDTDFEEQSPTQTQPVIEIHNPEESSGSITVDFVKIPWNDRDDDSTVTDGVVKHASSTACTLLSNQTLTAGDGLTINLMEAMQNCEDFPDCSATQCTESTQCGTNCTCLVQLQPPFGGSGTCVPLFGTVPSPSRVVVYIQIDDNGNLATGDAIPVRAWVGMVDNSGGTPSVRGLADANVEEIP